MGAPAQTLKREIIRTQKPAQTYKRTQKPAQTLKRTQKLAQTHKRTQKLARTLKRGNYPYTKIPRQTHA